MGRGSEWNALERTILCRAFIQVTNDPIHGADQKGEVFFQSIFKYCAILASSHPKGATAFAERGALACQKTLKVIFADVNKFNAN